MNTRESRRKFLQSGSVVAIGSITGCIGLPGIGTSDEKGLPLTIENNRSESYKITIVAIRKSDRKQYSYNFSINKKEELTQARFLSEVGDGIYKIKISLDNSHSEFFSDTLEFPADFTGRHLYVQILVGNNPVLNIYATYND